MRCVRLPEPCHFDSRSLPARAFPYNFSRLTLSLHSPDVSSSRKADCQLGMCPRWGGTKVCKRCTGKVKHACTGDLNEAVTVMFFARALSFHMLRE